MRGWRVAFLSAAVCTACRSNDRGDLPAAGGQTPEAPREGGAPLDGLDGAAGGPVSGPLLDARPIDDADAGASADTGTSAADAGADVSTAPASLYPAVVGRSWTARYVTETPASG